MVFTWCSHGVHKVFTRCSYSVHMVFTQCSSAVIVQFMLCSLFILWSCHYLMFMFSTIHLLFMQCSHAVHTLNSGWTPHEHRVNTMWTLHQHQVNTTKKFRQKWVWVATREEKISSPSSASLLGEEIFSSLVAIFGTFFASLLGEERFLHPIFYAMRIRWMAFHCCSHVVH